MSGSGRRFPWSAVAWTVLILAAMLAPGSTVPSTSWNLDKVAHFLLFGGFAWLWLRAAPGAWIRVGLVGLLYGVLTEVAQAVIPGQRTGDPMDVLADVLGLVAGILASVVSNRSGRAESRGE